MKDFASKVLFVCFILPLFVGLIAIFEWIGLHFKNSSVYTVLGIDPNPILVGMFLFSIVIYFFNFFRIFLIWLFRSK